MSQLVDGKRGGGGGGGGGGVGGGNREGDNFRSDTTPLISH